MPRTVCHPIALAAIAVASAGVPALAQLRICTWNVTNYNSTGASPSNSRDGAFQTAFYGPIPAGLAMQGQSMSPDVIIGQEFLTAAGVTTFRNILNSAPGSPGDWAAAPFLDGPDTESAFFYRTSKVQYLGTWTIALGSSDSCNQPRHTRRYDFRPVGYSAPAASIAAYSVHLKAQGSNAACPGGENAEGRRLIECQRIRANASGIDTNPNWVPAIGGANPPGSSALPPGFQFIMAGDTNIQNSSRVDYQALVGSQADNSGRFFDPIASPGTWNNNGTFRYIHTQDPATSAGMDDRHDQILVGAGLLDRDGLDYIFVPGAGGVPQTFSLATWNDPNHTYRCWGNDGGSFNMPLRTTGNTMVGPVIAQALITSAASGGHLPIIADFRVPAKVGSPAMVNFGPVNIGAPATATITISNAGDTARWSAAGIATLNYSLTTTTGFSAPADPFADSPGGAANTHTLAMDTSTPGPKTGVLTILSSDPDQPAFQVVLFGEVVVPTCPADFNGDGRRDPDDLADFITCFFLDVMFPGTCPDADFNADTSRDPDDLADFITTYFTSAC